METLQLRRDAEEAKMKIIENEKRKETSEDKEELAALKAKLEKKDAELQEQARSIQEENDRNLLNQRQEWQNEYLRERRNRFCKVC